MQLFHYLLLGRMPGQLNVLLAEVSIYATETAGSHFTLFQCVSTLSKQNLL